LSTFIFNEALRSGNTFTFKEVKFNQLSALLCRYNLHVRYNYYWQQWFDRKVFALVSCRTVQCSTSKGINDNGLVQIRVNVMGEGVGCGRNQLPCDDARTAGVHLSFERQ